MPGVLAVITGKDLEKAGLHWMPTLAGDKQMVLPVDEVMYQAQEVAAVIAETRYQAADAITAVYVDYEPLPVVVDPFKALLAGRPDPAPRPRARTRPTNHIWHWESGDRAATDAALAASDQVIPHRRLHPADPRRVHRDLRLHRRLGSGHAATWTSTSPARRRTSTGRSSAWSPGSRRRRSGSRPTTSAAGSAARSRSTRATSARSSPRSRSAGRSSGSRTGRRTSRPTRSPATTTSTPRWASTNDGTITGPAGQDARRPRLQRCGGGSVGVPGRPVQRHHGLVPDAAGVRRGRCRLHEQAAGRRRLSVLLPRDRGGPHDRAARRRGGPRRQHGPGGLPDEELHPEGPVPVSHPDRLGLRLRRLPHGAAEGARHHRLRRAPGGAGREARPGRAHGHRHLVVHRDRRRRARRTTSTSSASRCSTRPRSASTRPARPSSGSASRRQGQGHETTFAQIVAEELGHPDGQGQGRVRRHGHGALRARDVRLALDPDGRRRRGDRLPQDPREGAPDRRAPARVRARTTSNGRTASSPSRARRTGSRPSPRSPSRPTRTTRRGWRPASRRPTTTTRRT